MEPISLTGDFSREYNFIFSLYRNPISKVNFTDIQSVVRALFETIIQNTDLPYISQLARKVTVPPSVLETQTISIGTIDIQVPQKFKLEPFTVSYIDDELETVLNFHRGWQACVKRGWSFELLSIASLSCIMSTSVRTPLTSGVDIPTTVTNYPQIFPTKIKTSDFDRGGTSLREVTVDYIRIPKIVTMSSVSAGFQSVQDKVRKYIKF